MGSSVADQAATWIGVLCAVTVTVLVARRELAPRTGTNAPVRTDEWRDYASGTMQIGPPTAAVTVVAFSDFQCPYCKRFADQFNKLRVEHPEGVRLIFRNLPIQRIHPHARSAALAAECAAEQGRFPEYHDALFATPDLIGKIPWSAFARQAGVSDTISFARCMDSPLVAGRLREDSAAAARLGVTGTPTLLVNRWRLAGAPRAGLLDSLVVAELKAAERR